MRNKKLMIGFAILIVSVVTMTMLASATVYPKYNDETDCRGCHGSDVSDRHHLLVANGTRHCTDCHPAQYDNVTQTYSTQIIRNCLICHPGKDHTDVHHILASKGSFVCSDCHPMIYDNATQTYSPKITWDCPVCHSTVSSIQNVTPVPIPMSITPVTVPTPQFDNTPPNITVKSPINGGIYLLNQKLIADWSVNDTTSGVAAATGTYPNGSVISTTSIGTNGIMSFNVSAADVAGNTNKTNVTYYIRYKFGGFLAPIINDGSSIFRHGSKIDIRFKLSDANLKNVATATAKLNFSLITPNITGKVLQPFSNDPTWNGGFFKYDSRNMWYYYNLDSKGLQSGTWQIRVDINDGSSHAVNISLQK